jgi:N-ethylmaleimide reductase
MSSLQLLTPMQLGPFQLRNRVVMAPLTRNRCFSQIPSPVNVEYYKQRSSAGLIISEGAWIEFTGSGWPHAPGVYETDQINGWKKVTDAVHTDGGIIFCQIW